MKKSLLLVTTLFLTGTLYITCDLNYLQTATAVTGNAVVDGLIQSHRAKNQLAETLPNINIPLVNKLIDKKDCASGAFAFGTTLAQDVKDDGKLTEESFKNAARNAGYTVIGRRIVTSTISGLNWLSTWTRGQDLVDVEKHKAKIEWSKIAAGSILVFCKKAAEKTIIDFCSKLGGSES